MAFDKTKPAGTTPLKTSDDQIRSNNEALETAIGQDHDFATGSTQTGKHKQVIFKAPITKPTLAADEGALFTKTVSTKSELFFEDEDGNEVQLTSRGMVNAGVPVGSIIAFLPGSFRDGSNGTYTFRLGSANTIAAINTLLNASGWYVCDGSALNLSSSPIFAGSGRYLPNLTTDRFLMGDTVAGGIGGANSSTHTHIGGSHTLTIDEIPSHNHSVGGYDLRGGATYRIEFDKLDTNPRSATSGSTGGGHAHSHGATGKPSDEENRPAYLACFYIMRVV